MIVLTVMFIYEINTKLHKVVYNIDFFVMFILFFELHNVKSLLKWTELSILKK